MGIWLSRCNVNMISYEGDLTLRCLGTYRFKIAVENKWCELNSKAHLLTVAQTGSYEVHGWLQSM